MESECKSNQAQQDGTKSFRASRRKYLYRLTNLQKIMIVMDSSLCMQSGKVNNCTKIMRAA
jgi:hypothetical protein